MEKSQQRYIKEPQYKNSTMPSFLISIYLIVMFSLFPVFLTKQFVHARTDKFWFYLIASILMIVGVVIASIMDYSEEKRVHKATLRFMPLSAADIAFLCFYGFAAISTLLSEYRIESLLGIFKDDSGAIVGGRNNGLLLMTIYLAVYLVITRRYIFKEYIIAIYLVFSSAVSLFAILNYFYIDLIGVYNGYVDLWSVFDGKINDSRPYVLYDFGSTLGNKNFISSFICLFLPIAVMTFVLAEKRYLRIIAGFAIVFAYAGLLCSDSSSGILGLIVVLAAMAIFAAQRYVTLKRYLLAIAIMLTGGVLLRLFSLIMDDRSKGFEFIQEFLIYDKTMNIVLAAVVFLFILMQLFEKKLSPHYPKKSVTVTLIVLTCCGILAAIGSVIYFSLINSTAELSDNLNGILRFDEHWGTHRGYFWIHGLEQYGDFDFVHKLFGSGPDTVYAVMKPFFKEMVKLFDEGSTDCIHNEYLNYLITQGALGLLSYLALLGTVTVRAIRRAKNNPMILVFLAAVICYAAQSVVNLYQPITTPLFFLFLTLTETLNRNTPLNKEQSE